MNPEDENLEEGYEWVEAWNPVSLPEFVEQSAKGEMKMIDGRRFYSLPPIPTLDLPHGYTWEAFRRKVRHSARKHVTLTLKKAEQPAYHSHLVTQFSKLPTNYPCIGCTIAIDDSTVQMSMTCINSVDALRCIAKHISYLQFRLD